MDKTLLEAIKELLRVIVLAIIPITIDSLASGELNIKLIAITGAIAGLRALDKLLHEWGKEIEANAPKKKPVKSNLKGGITRF